jgi:hypothetical protein
MKTARIPDWLLALDALVKERWAAPFLFGANDCCLFAADCVLAVTGQDPAHDLRGAYSTEKGAALMVRKFGGVPQLAKDRLGEEIPPTFLQVGDVALVRMQDQDMLAVCFGSHLLAPGPEGLVYVPIEHALQAWRCTRKE